MIPKKIKKIYLNNVDENGSEMQNTEYIDLSQVWHDANEEPNLIDNVLIQFVGGRCDVYTLLIKAQADLWHDWCKEYEVLRWAYVKDLLPKGGRK